MIDESRFRAECGYLLCKWRQHRKMTREQLAEAIGSSPKGVERFETGSVEMPLSLLARCSIALAIEPRDLLPMRATLIGMVRS
jgi:transcriptional regulator with XRE-family HTH domain